MIQAAIGAFLIVLGLLGCTGEGSQPARSSVENLVKRLGSDVYSEREQATLELLEREEAAPLLRGALSAPDAEVTRRAKSILNEFARRSSSRQLTAIQAAAKDRRVD